MTHQVSDTDEALLDTLKAMELESKEDLQKWLDTHKPEEPSDSEKQTNVQILRISIFYGEPNKGEVSYLTFKYKLNCLLNEKSYSHDQILLGIRCSCKREATNVLRIGVHFTLEDMLQKFENYIFVINCFHIASLHHPWYTAFSCMLREKTLRRNRNKLAVLEDAEPGKISIGLN